jgi:hypothetical protein
MRQETKMSGPATETPPEDPLDLNHLRVMIGKKRKWNSYWDWPDRAVKERGIVADILRQSGIQSRYTMARENRPTQADRTFV